MNIPEGLLNQNKQLRLDLKSTSPFDISKEFTNIVDYLNSLGLDTVYIYHIFGYEYTHDDHEAYEYLTHC